MRPNALLLSAAAALLAAFVAVDPLAAQGGATPTDSVEVRLTDRQGREIGTAHLTRSEDGVRIRAAVTGIDAGQHGFHIHARGACDPPSFDSAGPHYQPEDRSHGFLDPAGPHAGDLPTLEVNAGGTIDAFDYTTARVRLSAASLLDADGSSLILHADADDYLTGTGGGSGDRIACGVISPADGG